MTTDFDNRPRFLQCSVDGCDENSGTYQDTNTGDPLRYRVSLCDKHRADRDAGKALLLAPSRVQWLLLSNAPTLVEQAKATIDATAAKVASQSKDIEGLQVVLADTRAAVETVKNDVETLKKA